MSGFLMDLLGIYYILVFVLAGICGSLFAMDECDILSQSIFKQIFMYQYAVYQIVKEDLDIVGIIILEILTTFSVWFLNIIIFIIICLYYVLLAVWKLFYFIFKKR